MENGTLNIFKLSWIQTGCLTDTFQNYFANLWLRKKLEFSSLNYQKQKLISNFFYWSSFLKVMKWLNPFSIKANFKTIKNWTCTNRSPMNENLFFHQINLGAHLAMKKFLFYFPAYNKFTNDVTHTQLPSRTQEKCGCEYYIIH